MSIGKAVQIGDKVVVYDENLPLCLKAENYRQNGR